MKLYTGGTFDLFHAGHVKFLASCRALVGPEGTIVVALNTDEFVASFKGKWPICSYEDRHTTLASCKYVNRIIKNEGEHDSKPAIDRIRPNIVAVGSDWAKKDYYAQMGFTQEWLDERGIVLVYLPYTPGISSTQLRENLG